MRWINVDLTTGTCTMYNFYIFYKVVHVRASICQTMLMYCKYVLHHIFHHLKFREALSVLMLCPPVLYLHPAAQLF